MLDFNFILYWSQHSSPRNNKTINIFKLIDFFYSFFYDDVGIFTDLFLNFQALVMFCRIHMFLCCYVELFSSLSQIR